MSHISTIKAKVTNIDALEAAARELGLEFRRNKTTQLYYGTNTHPCLHTIGSKNTKYEIGVVADKNGGYGLTIDWHSGDNTLPNIVGKEGGKLIQHYGLHAATADARRRGLIATRKQLDNGSIQLVVTGTSL